jgi:hypothetical protein
LGDQKGHQNRSKAAWRWNGKRRILGGIHLRMHHVQSQPNAWVTSQQTVHPKRGTRARARSVLPSYPPSNHLKPEHHSGCGILLLFASGYLRRYNARTKHWELELLWLSLFFVLKSHDTALQYACCSSSWWLACTLVLMLDHRQSLSIKVKVKVKV